MGAITDSVKGFGVTFSHMFRKVVTTKYPFEHPVAAPRYHGRHILNRHPDGLEKCIGCELCAWACPADAIYVEGAENTDEQRFSPGERYASEYQINYARCIFCGLCIEACPTRALTMSNEYELARDNRQDLIFTKEQLLAPLLAGMEAPPHPMWLGDSERDYYIGALTNPGTSAGAERAGLVANVEDAADDTGSAGGTANAGETPAAEGEATVSARTTGQREGRTGAAHSGGRGGKHVRPRKAKP